MDKHLKIGEFALLAGVSVKTLRFYADEGLLLPAAVDPKTGYRFYEKDQLADAVRILNLREAGVSLGDIRALNQEVGATDERIIGVLQSQRASLIKDRARIEGRLRIVDGLIASIRGDSAAAISKLRVVSIDPEFVYSLRNTVDLKSDSVTEMFERAERRVAAEDARANRSPFMSLHDTADAQAMDVEVCIPVIDSAIDRLPAQLVSGAEIACSATYSGGYHQTPVLRDHIEAYLLDSGLRPTGPMREVYRRFAADQDGYTLPRRVLATSTADLVTQVQLPIAVAKNP